MFRAKVARDAPAGNRLVETLAMRAGEAGEVAFETRQVRGENRGRVVDPCDCGAAGGGLPPDTARGGETSQLARSLAVMRAGAQPPVSAASA